MSLTDQFDRQFAYLRLSITDVCNFRCSYCLPHGYHQANNHCRFLSLQEIKHLIDAFSELGVKKIRLTGGEPTLRRDFLDIVRLVSDSSIEDIAVTTNGYRLLSDAQAWLNAGITAINVSIDSLQPEHFKQITGRDNLSDLLAGIDKALALGFRRVKVNSVLMKGYNDKQLPDFLNWIKDKPIQLRFIELMETGLGREYFKQHHASAKDIFHYLIEQGWQIQSKVANSGPAEVLNHPDYEGQIGFIMPYGHEFCASCNRLRVSSVGNLHLCLFGSEGILLRDLLTSSEQKEALVTRIRQSVLNKPRTHFLHLNQVGLTDNLSYIGG